MDSEEFDDLVARLTSGSSRRETVRGVLAGSLAAAGVPMFAEAKNGKGKRKPGKSERSAHWFTGGSADGADVRLGLPPAPRHPEGRASTTKAGIVRIAKTTAIRPRPRSKRSACAVARVPPSARHPPALAATIRASSARSSSEASRTSSPSASRSPMPAPVLAPRPPPPRRPPQPRPRPQWSVAVPARSARPPVPSLARTACAAGRVSSRAVTAPVPPVRIPAAGSVVSPVRKTSAPNSGPTVSAIPTDLQAVRGRVGSQCFLRTLA